jgi:hypothetical protein
MIAKRNMEEERQLNKRQREADQQRKENLKNFGKVNIISSKKRRSDSATEAEDVDFEELD